MTLFNAARDLARRPQARIENPAVPLTSTTLIDMLGGAPIHAGMHVTEQGSLNMPAVWRAVTLLAGTLASLPLHAYRSADDVRLPVSDRSTAARLLTNPHPDLTPFELWEIVFGHVALWGNAYLRVLRDGLGRVAELWPIHPGRVWPFRETDTAVKRYRIDGDDGFTDQHVLHIAGFGYDGVEGLSAIKAARQGVGLALAAEQYGAALFGNGSLASGVLSTDQPLDGTKAAALKQRWRERSAGLSNAHDVVVLDNGAKFQQLSIPPEDAQFIESRKFQIDEIARMFGLPPHMLAQTEKSTSWGTGIEQQSIGFVVYTLRSWLIRAEQRLSRLLRPEEVYCRYAVEGLLRGDTQQRAAFYTQMWNIGALSTNDVRRLEDMPPVEGGDVRYRPLNMGELGKPDPQTEPARAPADDDEEVPA